MSRSALAAGIRRLRSTMDVQQRRDDSDEQLLHAFTTNGNEAAFAVLMRRHGPMVLHVCCRVLGHEQDAEDAFQAIFLVLARHAAALRNKTSLVSFLHGTAYRTAMKAKQTAARRRKHEKQAPARSPADPAEELSWREARDLLDEEIDRLPEKYRSAFVLFHLEELSREETAQRLGVTDAAVAKRLAEARKRLAQRLARRGVELTTVLTVAAVAAPPASALPLELMASTIKAALAMAAGEKLASVVSASVAKLVKSATAAMLAGKAKIIAVVLLAASLFVGAGAWTCRILAMPEAAERQALTPNPQAVSGSQPAPARNPPTQRQKIDRVVTVSGQVLRPDGKPLSGATVYYYLSIIASPSGKGARDRRATSGADGRFRFQIPQSDLDKLELDAPWEDKVVVVAVVAGYGPAWTSFTTSAEASGLRLQLVKDDVPINARILNLEGRPIPGITVRALAIEDAQFGRLDLDELALPPMETITDAQGRLILRGIGRERDVELSLRGPTIAASEREVWVMTRHAKPYSVPINKARPQFGKIYYYGATSDIVAAPTKPIVGTIRDKDTGKPLAGVTIRSQRMAGHDTLSQDFLQTTSDRDGRYCLVGMPKGKGNVIVATAAEGQPYFLSNKEVNDTLGLLTGANNKLQFTRHTSHAWL